MATKFGPKTATGSFDNVWAEVRSVTRDEALAASCWWIAAQADVSVLAGLAGVEYDRMCFAVAAVSPGIPWSACLQNVRVLIEARAGGRPLPSGPGCGLEIPVGRRHVEKAWEIIGGGDVALCRGPKVEALAANLRGDLSAVAIDRHMTMIATGGESRQVGRVECLRIGTMFATAAFASGVQPAVAMAALWLRRNTTRAVARRRGDATIGA